MAAIAAISGGGSRSRGRGRPVISSIHCISVSTVTNSVLKM
jgi:hypothetical protein